MRTVTDSNGDVLIVGDNNIVASINGHPTLYGTKSTLIPSVNFPPYYYRG